MEGVAVVDEDVVVSAFGVHLSEGEGDVVGIVLGQTEFAAVRLDQPFAVCVLKKKKRVLNFCSVSRRPITHYVCVF